MLAIGSAVQQFLQGTSQALVCWEDAPPAPVVVPLQQPQ
jgi:hypothetical protein